MSDKPQLDYLPSMIALAADWEEASLGVAIHLRNVYDHLRDVEQRLAALEAQTTAPPAPTEPEIEKRVRGYYEGGVGHPSEWEYCIFKFTPHGRVRIQAACKDGFNATQMRQIISAANKALDCIEADNE